jgi:transposase
MSQSRTLSVGIAVHKASMAVASVAQEHGAEVVSLGPSGTRHGDMEKRLRQLQSKRTPLGCVYEAGPCGSWLSRSLMTQGCVYWVVAPSLIPKQPDDRVTTDRREARPLARLMRSGALTPVSVPALDEAAIRALSRARAETLRDLQAAQWRLQAFVLRPDIRSPGRAPWSPAHRRGRSEVVCPTPAQQIVFQAYVQPGTAQTARLGRLALDLHKQVTTWRFAPVVEALQARRGVQGPVAVTTGAARGDLTRCEHPRQLRHSLGRTPSASARGARRQQGSRTKTGQAQDRRARVEGAWA